MHKHNSYLYVTAFSGGLVSLAVELAASSLLRPHFGTANLVWAAIIGLILLYLTAGYFIGGFWADRSPHPATLYQIVAWAGLLIGIIPFAAHPVLSLASPGLVVSAQSSGFADFNIAMIAGSFIAVLILFSIPVTLLGCVSPFIIRLAVEDVKSTGQTAGRIYAISTAGSFLGTFLPDLLLVPTIGTRHTFVLLSLLLLTVALIGLARSKSHRLLLYLWMPALIVLLALILRGQPVKAAENSIYETESAYNYIQVVEREGCRYLLLNEGQGIHSVYCPAQLRTSGPWDYFLIAPYFNPPPYTPDRVESVALVGLAAGTIARQYTAAYGPLPIDGVEIDAKIVNTGREYFAMEMPNLTTIVADGRYYLAHSERRYTVVGVDAYRLPYIPPHLTTVEFFHQVRDHLTSEGVVVINVGHTPQDYRLVEAMLATLLEVFPSAHVIDVPYSFNAIVVATVQPSQASNLLANLPGLEGNEFLYPTALQAAANLRSTIPGQTIFTDDRASIEWMTNALVFDFVRGKRE
ncbi:MAG: fused MFS/spermidine synthase [Chloroflexota bacterium]|nr:fused MFS/spermidine synthase [Chloroflexota bacterium]